MILTIGCGFSLLLSKSIRLGSVESEGKCFFNISGNSYTVFSKKVGSSTFSKEGYESSGRSALCGPHTMCDQNVYFFQTARNVMIICLWHKLKFP